MTLLSDTHANLEQTDRLRRVLAELLGKGLRRGFHGTLGIELKVQDGTIQEVLSRVEQVCL